MSRSQKLLRPRRPSVKKNFRSTGDPIVLCSSRSIKSGLARLPQPIAGAAPHTKETSYRVMISLLADLFMIGLSGYREPVELLGGATVAIFILHRRTFCRTVRAKNAAIARLRARLAVRAFVEKLACLGRHRFTFSEAANGAHQHGLKENFAHTRFTCGQWKDSPRPQSLWSVQRDWLCQDRTKYWRFSYPNPLSRQLRQALSRVFS